MKEGLKLAFGKVIDHLNKNDRENIEDLLLRCLASIVYYKDEIKKFYSEIPNHSFSALHLLCHNKLPHELSLLITTEKSNRIPSATGILSHIHMLKSLHEVINL